MRGISDDWCFFADIAAVVYEFCGGVEEFAAFVALVSSCIGMFAGGVWTDTADVAISQEQVAILAVTLGHVFL